MKVGDIVQHINNEDAIAIYLGGDTFFYHGDVINNSRCNWKKLIPD